MNIFRQRQPTLEIVVGQTWTFGDPTPEIITPNQPGLSLELNSIQLSVSQDALVERLAFVITNNSAPVFTKFIYDFAMFETFFKQPFRLGPLAFGVGTTGIGWSLGGAVALQSAVLNLTGSLIRDGSF